MILLLSFQPWICVIRDLPPLNYPG